MQIASHAMGGVILAARPAAPSLELAETATLNGWRFGAAALLYWLLTRKHQQRYTRADLLGGATVGFFFGVGIFLQLLGLRYTLPSTSGFLTSLPVMFAPIAQACILRRPVGVRTWLAVAIAVVGISVLSQSNPDAAASGTLTQSPPLPYLGQMVTVLGSILFTGQILAVDHFGRRASTARLTFLMLAVSGAINGIGGFCLGGHVLYSPKIFSGVLASPAFVFSFLTLVAMCSVVTNHLMNAFQPYVSPAAASVIYCLEPVFTTAFSVALQTERLSSITVIGGSIILFAVLIVALKAAVSPQQLPA